MTGYPSNDQTGRTSTGCVAKAFAGTLHALIAHILEQHHTYSKSELPELEIPIKEIIGCESDPLRARALALLRPFLRFRVEPEAHMKGEEVTLFSLIKRLNAAISSGQAAPRNSFGPLSNAVQFMNEDDDFENKLLGILAELSDRFARPPEAPSRYRALVIRLQALTLDLHEDIHKEDDLLFLEEIRLEADCVLAGKEKTP